MKLRALILASTVAIVSAACQPVPEAGELSPSRPAPPSRHAALRDALTDEARALGFAEGDWLEDLGDAPFFGLAWLSRRGEKTPLTPEETARRDASVVRARALLASDLLSGDLQEKVMAALGLIEHVAATGDRADVASIDAFLDRVDAVVSAFGDYLDGIADTSWAVRVYGPTAVTALVALVHAQYAHLVGGERKNERLQRASAMERKITDRALADLSDPATGQTGRGYAIGPGNATLELYPNVSMMMLESRLFLLTRDEAYRLQARALYASIQPLKLSDAPARYASPYAASSTGAKTREVATLSSQNYLALALMLLYETTGQIRFSEEADRVLDGIEAMRGPWCLAHVHASTCTPACASGSACVSGACAADKCASGLLHHVVDGRLAQPEDGTLFCSGCNLQTLYVLGYRRALAGEAF
ncbi:MAG: hypothetical protein KF819_21260 [Labilithrix sp.]|nr:hypothetical protein [Labilithrix sp.]